MNCGICGFERAQRIADAVDYCPNCGAVRFDLSHHGIKDRWHSTRLRDAVLDADQFGYSEHEQLRLASIAKQGREL